MRIAVCILLIALAVIFRLTWVEKKRWDYFKEAHNCREVTFANKVAYLCDEESNKWYKY